jgi:mRNA-degrading endonuclease toxin of MazEF toxin-antitoxin module
MERNARVVRGESELPLGPTDGMPEPRVASFDNLHTLRSELLRRRITRRSAAKMADACGVLARALGCV